MSLGLPGPLPTAFELQFEKRASVFTPDAATLTLYALSNLKSKKHRLLLFLFPQNHFFINLYMLRATQPSQFYLFHTNLMGSLKLGAL